MFPLAAAGLNKKRVRCVLLYVGLLESRALHAGVYLHRDPTHRSEEVNAEMEGLRFHKSKINMHLISSTFITAPSTSEEQFFQNLFLSLFLAVPVI